jgi:hypothetical protein
MVKARNVRAIGQAEDDKRFTAPPGSRGCIKVVNTKYVQLFASID